MMSNQNERCNAVRSDGTQCPHPVKDNAVYCEFHLVLNSLPDEEQSVIADFLEDNWKIAIGYFASAFGEAVVDDIYELLKTRVVEEQSETEIDECLRALVGEEERQSVGDAGLHYRIHRDAFSLLQLVPFLRIGMSERLINGILGKPGSDYVNSVGEEFEPGSDPKRPMPGDVLKFGYRGHRRYFGKNEIVGGVHLCVVLDLVFYGSRMTEVFSGTTKEGLSWYELCHWYGSTQFQKHIPSRYTNLG